ncbi:hypothetical protein CMO92_02320 [Candidatus Woesearchaeota archaeon]|nr:hypothetical protein [Candidatus Woesearchaeota archaeon]|tara:strand:- start:901 stop:1626 length:726 start_codon:yes stop_codon:yes gene_type:complete
MTEKAFEFLHPGKLFGAEITGSMIAERINQKYRSIPLTLDLEKIEEDKPLPKENILYQAALNSELDLLDAPFRTALPQDIFEAYHQNAIPDIDDLSFPIFAALYGTLGTHRAHANSLYAQLKESGRIQKPKQLPFALSGLRASPNTESPHSIELIFDPEKSGCDNARILRKSEIFPVERIFGHESWEQFYSGRFRERRPVNNFPNNGFRHFNVHYNLVVDHMDYSEEHMHETNSGILLVKE